MRVSHEISKSVPKTSHTKMGVGLDHSFPFAFSGLLRGFFLCRSRTFLISISSGYHFVWRFSASILSIMQSIVTSAMTAALTAFAGCGLAAVSTWFALEYWTYTHHKGRKWLGDVLEDIIRELAIPTNRVIERSHRRIKEALVLWERFRAYVTRLFHTRKSGEQNFRTGELPFNNPLEPLSTGGQSDIASYFDARVPSMGIHGSDFDGGGISDLSPTQGRFAHAVRSVMMMQSVSGDFACSFASAQPRDPTSIATGEFSDTTRSVVTLVPKLKRLKPTDDLLSQHAVIRHLQFSPDGRFMAASRYGVV